MRYAALIAPCLVALALAPAGAADPPRLELKDGDRVVYLGNTFVERDANYGYLETLLNCRFPDANFTFRNLGWSGDTVWGDARARFGTRADGFAHLKDHVLALKPTVLLVAYGMNESFAGEAGLSEFEKGLNALLDTLAETKARIILISPIPHENLGPPLPDPAKHNADLMLYRDAMARVAGSRSAGFVDLMDDLARSGESRTRLTDDGLHLTARGYGVLTWGLAHRLGLVVEPRALRLDEAGKLIDAEGWRVTNFETTPDGVKFEAEARSLPMYATPKEESSHKIRGGFVIGLRGFNSPEYSLKIDGKPVPVDDATLNGSRSLWVSSGPEMAQVETLRAAINKKNELYFHRWRPQNETYLFGFRKHEQGNNSVEIPQFDPLVAEQEAEIARLKKPASHSYELIRKDAGK